MARCQGILLVSLALPFCSQLLIILLRLFSLFRVCFCTIPARQARDLVEHDSRRLRCSPFRPRTSHANFSPGARFPGARDLIDFAHRIHLHMRARLQRFEHSEKRGVKFTLRFAQSEHVRSEMARSNLNIVGVVCRNSGYPTEKAVRKFYAPICPV